MGIKGKNKPKIIVVLGPTASGKSSLAVSLAKDFKGEIVSADSRQVYKGMDLGAGKITKQEMQKVTHYLLDIASPKKKFTAARYQKEATKAVNKILKNNNLPIICGGTAFYISTLVDGLTLPSTPPDWRFRERLEKMTNRELFNKLREFDKKRAQDIDRKNRRRLIRAVEIVEKTKKPITKTTKNPPYLSLFLGIKVDRETLDKKIDKRLQIRLKEGMIEEVKNLRESGISWQRLESFGLEYKWIALYLQEKVSYHTAVERLSTDIKKFSKRQMTWWKNDKRINWIKNYQEARLLVKNFLL